MGRHRVAMFAGPILLVALFASPPVTASGIGNSSPGTQTDDAYMASAAKYGVTNVFATTQTSCYRPEVPYTANAGPNRGYTPESPRPRATNGDGTAATRQYPTQA